MGMLATAPVEQETHSPTIAERRALLQRIAGSEHFRRSARLRDFLLYVGAQSFKDDCTEIHEQEVGAKVFGRAANYDRSQDNIVRVNATELRKRIEAYFGFEGAHEPLIVEIPRGGYKPVFHWRQADPVAIPIPHDAPPDLRVLPFEPPKRRRERTRFLWPALCLLLAVACLMLLRQNRAMGGLLYSWEREPAVASLWNGFVRGPRQTDIVLPDASVSISEEILGRHMSLSDYLDHKYTALADVQGVSDDRRSDVTTIFGHNLVAFGDFRAAQQILALGPAGSSLHLTLSRFFNAESLKNHNAILLGGKKANPWVRLFDDQTNFSLTYDDAHAQGFIENRHPQPGEKTMYSTSMDPNGLVGYTAVAYLPNPSHTGDVIILAGTDSDATSAAAEFLTSEEQLTKLQATLHAKRLPYFELLLKTSRLSGTSFNAELIAYRRLAEVQTSPGIATH